MVTRTHYWGCSSFADWLRGTPKPQSETSKGWSDWNKAAKAAHPFRYWLADDGLDYIQDIFYWPTDQLYSLKYYVNNRWVSRTHALTAHPRDIKPGEWQDVGNRFLPCLFNELVDFVEIEQAWHHIAWDKEARKKYNPPFYAWGWFRWRTWRCSQAGLDYLDWARNLKNDEEWSDETSPDYGKPTPQAIAAQEIKDLYIWWTETYRNRPDPYESSGWTAHMETLRSDDPDDFMGREDPTGETPRRLDALHQLEKQYEAEDESMIIRLIKIRNHLWT